MTFESLKIYVRYRSTVDRKIRCGLTQQAGFSRTTPPKNNVMSLVNGTAQCTLCWLYKSLYPFFGRARSFFNEYDKAFYFCAIKNSAHLAKYNRV
jgi:hypothetical protein